jgi:orotidine-5'-phosphate decarboxylase
MSGSYRERLAARIAAVGSHLVVGLDPQPGRLPEGVPDAAAFLTAIIKAVSPFAAAFKPNLAFFEAQGDAGRRMLAGLRELVPADIPLILDAKCADIGNTAEQYAAAFLDRLGMDAVTVNPYLGTDGIAPFSARSAKGVYVLCLTSNDSGGEFQQRSMADGRPLWHAVADSIRGWGTGAVIGATRSGDLATARGLLQGAPLLVPGVGAQGGDLGAVCRTLIAGNEAPVLVNASRAILYASPGGDFAEAAAQAASAFVEEMRAHLGGTR